MVVSTLGLFGAGVATGLGVWWLSLDRRRGKEVRELARTHNLPVNDVHEAALRALRYGVVNDFTFLIGKSHPQKGSTRVAVLPTAWRDKKNSDASCDAGEPQASSVESHLAAERS